MGRPLSFRRRRRIGGPALVAAGVFAAVLAVALPWSAPASGRAEPTLQGRPTRITDGDTFRFGETRVRLHGVDAPEMSTPEGREARRHLIALIGEGEVRCRDTGQRSYERVVAVCRDVRGRDLAAAMVESGWAKDAPRFSGGRYAALQARAERTGAGLFGR